MTDITNNAQSPSQNLNTGSPSLVQEYKPLENICGFLNAFHLYADDHSRVVEAHHYCSQLNKGEGRSQLWIRTWDHSTCNKKTSDNA